MTGFSDEIGRAVIAKHFPDADPMVVQWHAIWLSPPLVTALPPVHFVKEGGELDVQIDTFERAIRTAWQAYSAIPLHIRRKDEVDWIAFAKLVRNVTGDAILPGQQKLRPPPAIRAIRKAASEAGKLSAQAMNADHPAKVALVDSARNAWRDLSGTEPPVKTSPGSPFLDFVQDLIVGAGKAGDGWGAERTLAAWRTATA